MKNHGRFVELETDSGKIRFDQLPWTNRLWRAFQLGVTRKLDRLSVPNDA